jgi:hypothetical protein
MRRSVVRKLGGQVDGGPSEVFFHAGIDRMSSPSSPPPEAKTSAVLTGTL